MCHRRKVWPRHHQFLRQRLKIIWDNINYQVFWATPYQVNHGLFKIILLSGCFFVFLFFFSNRFFFHSVRLALLAPVDRDDRNVLFRRLQTKFFSVQCVLFGKVNLVCRELVFPSVKSNGTELSFILSCNLEKYRYQLQNSLKCLYLLLW